MGRFPASQLDRFARGLIHTSLIFGLLAPTHDQWGCLHKNQNLVAIGTCSLDTTGRAMLCNAALYLRLYTVLLTSYSCKPGRKILCRWTWAVCG